MWEPNLDNSSNVSSNTLYTCFSLDKRSTTVLAGGGAHVLPDGALTKISSVNGVTTPAHKSWKNSDPGTGVGPMNLHGTLTTSFTTHPSRRNVGRHESKADTLSGTKALAVIRSNKKSKSESIVSDTDGTLVATEADGKLKTHLIATSRLHTSFLH